MKFAFVADEPIEDSHLDDLGFAPFVTRVHDALAGTKTPFVYGLLGPWGSGKTSVQKLLASKFKAALQANAPAPPLYVPIWLDAWRYENQDNMIFPLLRAFHQSREELIGDAASETGFMDKLRTVAAASAVTLLDLGLRATTKQAFGDALKLKDIKENIEAVVRKPDEIEQLLSAWTKEVEGLRGKYEGFVASYAAELAAKLKRQASDIRFVVFVDDLDRCLPTVAIGLLENIRNHLTVPGCVYILGINPAVIARGIRAKYAGLEMSGREYLEKILNYSFAVPVPDAKALAAFGEARLADLLFDQADRDAHRPAMKTFGVTLAQHGFSNPRKIKRILNSYLLFLATQAGLNRFDMAHVTQLIVLAEYYPDLFRVADRGALAEAHQILTQPGKPGTPTPAGFHSTYGVALDGPLAELANMPNLLRLSASIAADRASEKEHIAAVRAVCGRV